jgi:GlpG protein
VRFIGAVPDAQQATRSGDYLTALGIANDVEQGSSGFAIWVHDDDYIERAKGELATFLAEPEADRFTAASKAAQRVRDDQHRRERSLRENYIDVRTRWAGLSNRPMPVTIVLIAICLLVAALTKLGTEQTATEDWLSFGTLSESQQSQLFAERLKERVREQLGRPGGRSRSFELAPPGLDEILRGQVWRLFTPMFLHFGIVHLIFNMIWLYDLGAAIERKRGAMRFLGIVLTSSLLANVAQFYWAGPYFGGMSGVVYGLFGYVWMKSKFEPHSGFVISQQTVMIMIAWLVICMVGVIGNVANAAHVSGLVTGMALAHAPTSWRRFRRPRGAV